MNDLVNDSVKNRRTTNDDWQAERERERERERKRCIMMDGDDVLWYLFSFGIVSTLPLMANDDMEKFSSQDHVGIRSRFYFELITFHHGTIYFRRRICTNMYHHHYE